MSKTLLRLLLHIDFTIFLNILLFLGFLFTINNNNINIFIPWISIFFTQGKTDRPLSGIQHYKR